MNRRTLAGIVNIIALLCLLSQAGPLRAASPAQDLAAEFEAFFRQRVAEENITGAAFVISSPESVVAVGAAGYTDVSKQQAIDENTVFRVASVSKTFAAGLAGILVSEGRFAWHDRVVEYVPDFRIDGDAQRVRIEHLLGQSTGLMPHAYDNLIEDGVPLDRIREKYGELTYLCQPGTCYSYQNAIFSLIEPIIEVTTEQTYAALMESRIFRPLEMRTASLGYRSFIESPNRALPHVKSRGQWKTVRVQPNYYRVAPAAGVNASALDMGKWLVAQMGGHPSVIDPAVVEALVEPRVQTVRDTRRKYWRDLISEAHYGLGWRIYRIGGYRIAYHSGWVSGYRADLAWSRQLGVGIAVLTNVEGSTISELTTTFWRMALERHSPAFDAERQRVAAVLDRQSP